MKKPPPTRRTRAVTADADPYKPARRPARFDAAARPARGERPVRLVRTDRAVRGDRPPVRTDRPARGDRPPVRTDRPVRGDRPPMRADRPARSDRPMRSDRPTRSFDRGDRPVRPPREGVAGPRFGARRAAGDDARAPARAERSGFAGRPGGFTVNLDPDVARVFRGDASVNKALRLVLQLMQVVQGPGPTSEGSSTFSADRPPRPSGYRGSAEARGFERKPKFEEAEEE